MRIISGDKRGLKLKTLESDNTRPTLDRVKESLFNILFAKRSDWENVLDLFAGSGGLGIEMLSRGSELVVFCDNNRPAIGIIEENINKCGYADKSQIMFCEYTTCISKLKKKDMKFDLILLDPPYNKGIGKNAIRLIDDGEILNDDGIIVLETSIEEEVPKEIGSFEYIDDRKYGKVKIYLYMRKG